jgi:tryptophan synthase alpha chain
MSRLVDVFTNNDKRGEKTLIPYITAGFPAYDDTHSLINMLGDAGADIIEIGVPFSDPLADGETIQQSSQKAIENGMTLSGAFEQIEQINLTKPLHPPLVMMTYYNIIYKYGLSQFVAKAAELDLDGLIVPDLPFAESSQLRSMLSEHSIDLIYMITPNTTDKRMADIVHIASGFIYLVSVNGVTGARDTLPDNLEHFVKKVRRLTSLPLALGFGISTPEIARAATQICDGVIVGSALIQRLMEDDSTFSNSQGFISAVSDAIDE